MSRLLSRGNVFRFAMILFVAGFITAIYMGNPGQLGKRVPVVLAEVGGVVDVQINDATGTFVFTPESCHTMIATLSECAATIQIKNVGGADSVEFDYSVELWADADGIDTGQPGADDDTLSDCFEVAISRSDLGGPEQSNAAVGPYWGGGPLAVGDAKSWSAEVQVVDDNACQGATTTVILAVQASNDPEYFESIKTPTVMPQPSATITGPAESPTAEVTTIPAGGGEEPDEEVAQAPEPTLEATPQPSPSLTPSTTPRAATATPVPATPVVPVAVTPTPEPSPSPTPISEEKPGRADGPNFLTQEIPSPSAISTDVEVIATNITLSLIALTVILVATTVFNSTLEENAIELGVLMNRVTGPNTHVGRVLGWIDSGDEDNSKPGWLATLIKPLSIVAITAMIYAALEPDFGFNDETLILVVALMSGIAMSTFLYEGGQVFWSSRRYRTPAAMRVYPMAIVIAAVSVVMTRFADLHPGVIFGFVTAATIFPRGMMSSREKGMIVLVPLVGLLATSVLAFFLIEPFRNYAEAHPGVWNALPETIAIALFVGGAQSALLILIPVTFNDGQKIWAWNKLVWLAIALPASFLFFHVMINSSGDAGDLIENGRATTLLITSFAFLGVAALTWLIFRIKNRDALD